MQRNEEQANRRPQMQRIDQGSGSNGSGSGGSISGHNPSLVQRNHQIEEQKLPSEERAIFQNVSQRQHINRRESPSEFQDLILDGLQSESDLENDFQLNLSPRQAVTNSPEEQIKSFFICQICLKVILDPLECQKCQTAFCGKCIQKWVQQKPLENQAKCPIRCTQTEFLPIHRFAKQELKQQRFKCPYTSPEQNDENHQSVKIYDEALKHLRSCAYRKITCQCGELVSNSMLRQHLQVCTKARVYCRNCEISYNYQQEEHDCVKYLRDKCKEYKISAEREKFYHANIAMKCPNGHPLYPQKGKTHWQIQYGFIFCDTCKLSDLSTQKCFWRCLHQCDFDLCHECLYKAMPPVNPNIYSVSSAGINSSENQLEGGNMRDGYINSQSFS